MSILHFILLACGSLVGEDADPCAGKPQVGPFTVTVVEMNFEKDAAVPRLQELDSEPTAGAVMLRSEYFEFVEHQDALPHAIVALRHYARGHMNVLEWDTIFEGGQLVLSEHQVLYGAREPVGEYLKTIWRERALGQGAAHTVIAETEAGDVDARDWHVLRYGLRSEAHGTVTRSGKGERPAKTRLGLLQEARLGHRLSGPLALWNGELGIWEEGQVRTINADMSLALDSLQAGRPTNRTVIWSSVESSNHLAFQLSGTHCFALQVRQRGPWARSMQPDAWQHLNRKWRREAPVQDPGARVRAFEAAAPFLNKQVHATPAWNRE